MGWVIVLLAFLAAYIFGSMYPLPYISERQGSGVTVTTTVSERSVETSVITIVSTMTKSTLIPMTVTETVSSTHTITSTTTYYYTSTVTERGDLGSVQLLVPSFRLSSGDTELMVSGRYLILRYTTWRPILLIIDENNNALQLYLTPFQVRAPAVYVKQLYYDGLYYTEIYDSAEVAREIASRGFTSPQLLLKALNDRSWLCRVDIGSGAVNITGCRETYVNVEPGEGITLIEAVVKYVNTTSISYVSSLLYHGNPSSSLAEASWMVLEWLTNNTSYDYEKANSNVSYIYDPITFANLRKGICTDYALFTVAALVNLTGSTYILVFNTTRVAHAVAGVVVDGGFFVLDQSLPPIELEDYFSSLGELLGGVLNSDIFLYRVWLENGSVRLSITRLTLGDLLRIYPDTNPSDDITDVFMSRLTDYLKTLYKYDAGSAPTEHVEVKWGGFRYYSDVFVDQYVKYVVDNLKNTLPTDAIITSVSRGGPYTVYIYFKA